MTPTHPNTEPMTPEEIRQADIEAWIVILRLSQSQTAQARRQLKRLGVSLKPVSILEPIDKTCDCVLR